MSLISTNIPNLINGVSQQPPTLRLASQAEEQINGLSDVVSGLSKRPPTEYTNTLRKGSPTGSTLTTTELNRSFFHTYKRSDTEQFTVIYDPPTGKMRVYDINGSLRYESGVASWNSSGALITSNSDSTAYLHSIKKDDIASTSVADYTFFVNKNKVVTKDTSTPSNPRPYEGMFYMKKIDYAKTYQCEIVGETNGYWVTYSGSSADSHAHGLDSGRIMDVISGRASLASYGGIGGTNGSGTGNAGTPSADSMSITGNYSLGGSAKQPYFTVSNSTNDFVLKSDDGTGGTSLFTHKDASTTFTGLPKYCAPDFTIQVNGDNQKKEDDFYVKFTGDESSGTWKECPAPSRPSDPVYHSFNESTMPHRLNQLADESFSFGEATWGERKAGDEDTNPFPSFEGGAISDVFFHRNRLGFLSEENVIFSETSSFFNFFRTTVRSLLDTDVIDVAVSNDSVSLLKKAIPFSEQLLLLSDTAQFNLAAGTLLTPSEVTVNLSTTYETDLSVSPVTSGSSVFMAQDKGASSGIREYFVASDTDLNAAEDVTSNIPTYIKGNITGMAVSSNENTLLVTTDADPKCIYVHRWYIADNEKVQSSWSKWLLKGDILHMAFNGMDVYLLVGYGSESHMEKINLSEDSAVAVTSTKHPVLLDRRVKLDSASDTVPYTDTDLVYMNVDGKYVSSPSTYPTYAGVPYTFSYTFSEQVFKPDPSKPITIARYQLRNFNIVYSDTSTFDVTVSSIGRDPRTSTFTGNLLGSSSFVLGTANVVPNGTHQVAVQSQASATEVTLSSSSPLPCNFTSAEVEGFVTIRSQRI